MGDGAVELELFLNRMVQPVAVTFSKLTPTLESDDVRWTSGGAVNRPTGNVMSLEVVKLVDIFPTWGVTPEAIRGIGEPLT